VNLIAFCERPLHIDELLNSIAYATYANPMSDDRRPVDEVIDLAKPFIHMNLDRTVSFAHFTARQ
jgi:hypothetical protein